MQYSEMHHFIASVLGSGDWSTDGCRYFYPEWLEILTVVGYIEPLEFKNTSPGTAS